MDGGPPPRQGERGNGLFARPEGNCRRDCSGVLGETDTLRLVRSGRSPDWLKSKNPACAAAAREAEAKWGK